MCRWSEMCCGGAELGNSCTNMKVSGPKLVIQEFESLINKAIGGTYR